MWTHRPLERAGSTATWAIRAASLAMVGIVVAAVWDFRLLGRIDNGETISLQELDRLELLQDGSFLVFLLGGLVAGISYLIWSHRAYSNLNDKQQTDHRPGWAIGCWFVPFINLWRPMTIMRELLEDTQKRARETPPLLWIWWVSLLATMFNGNASSEPTSVGEARLTAVFTAISAVLLIAAGLALVSLIRDITSDQTRRETGANEPLRQFAPRPAAAS